MAAFLLVPILTLCALSGIFTIGEIENEPPVNPNDTNSIQTNFSDIERVFITNNDPASSVVVEAEVADTAEERARGLMGREMLAEDSGMLFVFPTSQEVSFWMKDTVIPLDIIFIREDLTIESIAKNTTPLQTSERYNSQGEVLYVLEVNAGFSDENNFSKGDKLELNFASEGGGV
ncbi:MAG: DUF192 domain-containing protein [Candidatus Dojkabacteria bacterium]